MDFKDIDSEFNKIHDFAKFESITSMDYTEEEFANHFDVVEKCAQFIPIYSPYPEKYENIAFYDKDGFLALPNGKVLQLPNKPYIVGPCNGEGDYVDDPRFSTVNNQVLMFLSTVVKDKNGNSIGCIVDVLRGNFLNDICESIELNDGTSPVIVNLKTKQILSQINDEGFEEEKLADYTNFILKTLM